MQTINPIRTLPETDNQISTLALGCWSYGGAQWGGQEDEDSIAAMKAAVDHGITHFDNATAYGGGRAEKVLGRFLAEHDVRDRLFIASKFNVPHPDGPEAAVDQSRERMGIDTIDLYYFHWPKTGADHRPWMEQMEHVRESGKIRFIGVSNFSVEQMREVGEVGRIDACQPCYSLLWRFPEKEVLPYCREHGIAVATYSSLARGILTGKFGKDLPEFPKGDDRGNCTWFHPEVWPHTYEAVEQMKAVADRVGRPLVHLALQWVAAQDGVTSVLLGARDAEQAVANAAAIKDPVSEDVLRELTAISDEVTQHIPDTGNPFDHHP